MRKYALILDPAHGIDVAGKQSPDGSFHEWKWSREMIKRILSMFMDTETSFELLCPYMGYDIEPGLRRRVDTYNQVSKDYEQTIMLSLHVDAFRGWWNGTGFSFFTSRYHNMSDHLANVMAKTWEMHFHNERVRRNSVTDASKDKNFTVLAGYQDVPAKYFGILVENGFMDSHVDLPKLKDPTWNDRLTKIYYLAIINMFEFLDKMKIKN